MNDDPLIAEIRRVRMDISERFGHDPKRIVEYFMEMEKKYRAEGKLKFADSNDLADRLKEE